MSDAVQQDVSITREDRRSYFHLYKRNDGRAKIVTAAPAWLTINEVRISKTSEATCSFVAIATRCKVHFATGKSINQSDCMGEKRCERFYAPQQELHDRYKQ